MNTVEQKDPPRASGAPPRTSALESLREVQGQRQSPGDAFIERMRSTFTVEPELDRILTAKLRNRQSTENAQMGFEELVDRLHRFFDHELGAGTYELTGCRWLTGGASKIQIYFELQRADDDAPVRLVARIDPTEGMSATSRLREYELFQVLQGVIPVPRSHYVDPDGTWFGTPALIYDYVPGVTKPTTDTAQTVSGVGTRFTGALQQDIGEQFARQLGALHSARGVFEGLSTFAVPRVGHADDVDYQIGRVRRVWAEDTLRDLPILEVADRWLEQHKPQLDVVSLIHGDYRTGNFLFDEQSHQITAWLDFERSYLGDRHRDLAWTIEPLFGTIDADGRVMVGDLIEKERFFSLYEESSGLPIDPDRLAYYRVLNSFQFSISLIATAARVVTLGLSHQDILLNYTEGVVPTMLSNLQESLAAVW